MAYPGSRPSPSREGKKYKAFWLALGSFQLVWVFGPCPLEPAGRSRKSSAVDRPPGEGGSGLGCCCCCSRGLFRAPGEGRGGEGPSSGPY